MAIFNNYNREQIYEEMDGPSYSRRSGVGNIISKTLSIVLLLISRIIYVQIKRRIRRRKRARK